MTYTIKTLQELNLYRGISISQDLVDIINNIVQKMESRPTDIAQAGDIVRYTNELGRSYMSARIETAGDCDKAEGKTPICCSCEESEIRLDGDNLIVRNRGTNWTSFRNKAPLKPKGREKKPFMFYSINQQNYIYFEVYVGVWEYTVPYKYTRNGIKYTTKDYVYHEVSFCPQSNQRFIEYGNFSFGTEIEFQAWLKLHHGVVFPGDYKNRLVVFSWESVAHEVNLKKYDKINAPENTITIRGHVRKCKIVEDEVNRVVNIYYIWYDTSRVYDDSEDYFVDRQRQEEDIFAKRADDCYQFQATVDELLHQNLINIYQYTGDDDFNK